MNEKPKPQNPFNLPPHFSGFNAFTGNLLLERLCSGLSASVKKQLSEHGQWAGRADIAQMARLANTHLPHLKNYDARGNRIGEIEFHPSWHAFMRQAHGMGLQASIWEDGEDEKGNRHLARAARLYISAGVEAGHLSTVSMTNAALAGLNHSPDIAKEWLPLITPRQYDPSNRPPIAKKQVIIGMGFTEKQGGADLNTNTTRAEQAGEGIWRLNGHKWFLSAPQSDAFLITAQTEKGLGCFLLPRLLPDGSDNGFRFLRLKDKVGNRSNATAEVEFEGSLGQLIGEAGKAEAVIGDVVSLTRFDNAVVSAGLMQMAVWETIEHCRHRIVLGAPLIKQPLMTRVLADLALDVAAATALTMRLAQAHDRASANPVEAQYVRMVTPVAKYWICKIAPALIAEAIECVGGNGYVEEGNLARHYREAPFNAIWEGPGNMMCFEVLRLLAKSPETIPAVLEILEHDLGGERAIKTIDVMRSAQSLTEADPGSVRILTEQLALTAASAELRRIGMHKIADAFMQTRLGGLWRSTYGMLDNRFNAAAILNELHPEKSVTA